MVKKSINCFLIKINYLGGVIFGIFFVFLPRKIVGYALLTFNMLMN